MRIPQPKQGQTNVASYPETLRNQSTVSSPANSSEIILNVHCSQFVRQAEYISLLDCQHTVSEIDRVTRTELAALNSAPVYNGLWKLFFSFMASINSTTSIRPQEGSLSAQPWSNAETMHAAE